MTLGQKYLNYAKNICELKKGYNLDNARKYFGKDYSNFVVFYRTFREAKETVRHNKEALTVRQMQYIGSLIKELQRLIWKSNAIEIHQKALDKWSYTAQDIINQRYNIINTAKKYGEDYKVLTRNIAEKAYYDYHGINYDLMFNETFTQFVKTYYVFDDNTKTYYLNEGQYQAKLNSATQELSEVAMSVINVYKKKAGEYKEAQKEVYSEGEIVLQKMQQAKDELQDLIGATFEVPL